MKKTMVVIALLLTTVLTGCAVAPMPVEPRPGPVIDIDQVADLKLQTALYDFENKVLKQVQIRVSRSNGYPPYAVFNELSGTTEYEVTVYGAGKFNIRHLSTEGHDIFTDYGREAVRFAMQRTYVTDELENVNFRFRVTVAYRI